jgi:hypothetical protein
MKAVCRLLVPNRHKFPLVWLLTCTEQLVEGDSQYCVLGFANVVTVYCVSPPSQ